MSNEIDEEVRRDLQPAPADVSYDLERALGSVVSLRATIPEDAFTASVLGTERAGNGVLIRENGLIVTIGYLITEATEVWLVGNSGVAVPGHVVGYDQETGLGLVQALGRLDVPAMEIGNSSTLRVGDTVVLGGFGGRKRSVRSRVVGKREFAGYWEYVLDEAIFTSPPHPNWGGTALIAPDGRLAGIGSLYIQHVTDGERTEDGNMVVPIDILKPIMNELLTYGKTRKPPRPWLGMMTTEAGEHLVVAGVVKGGPAHKADVRAGDVVLGVGNDAIDDLATLFRRIWSLGEAGVEVPLVLHRDGDTFEVRLRSANRSALLKAPPLH